MLTGLSEDQVGSWRRDGFYIPHYPSGLYSFRDIVGLRTLAILRNDRNISRQKLKRFGEWLMERYDEPWSTLRFATDGDEVVLLEDDERMVSASPPGQGHLAPFPVDKVELAMRTRALETSRRAADELGEISRRRGVQGGRACVAGTRIPTSAIMEFHRAGYTAAEIVAEYPGLTEGDVEAAIAEERGAA